MCLKSNIHKHYSLLLPSHYLAYLLIWLLQFFSQDYDDTTFHVSLFSLSSYVRINGRRRKGRACPCGMNQIEVLPSLNGMSNWRKHARSRLV